MRKIEFANDAIEAALNALDINTENHAKLVELMPTILADDAKCREIVRSVQGDAEAVGEAPVDMERYRKRVERMLKQFTAEPVTDAGTADKSSDKASDKPSGTGNTDTKSPVADNTKSEAKSSPSSKRTRGGKAETKSATPGGKSKEGSSSMAKKAKVAPSTKSKKAPKGDKAPGVIDTIVSILQSGGGTVEQIAAKVHKKFPDRKLDGLTATTKIQMSRLATPKSEGGRGIKIKKEKQEGTNVLIYSA